MLIFDENSHAIIIDSITTPITTEYFWVLDLDMQDFTLAPLYMLEEIVAPTITLQIKNFTFNLPSNWNILVYSEDTTQLDIIEVGEIAGRDYTAMIYGPNIGLVTPGLVTAIDYEPEGYNFAPSCAKNQMICHPISGTEWINVSSSDVYNKYLKECTVGDIIK